MKIKIKPEVDMGATLYMWGDKLACTIIYTSKNKRKLIIQKDIAIQSEISESGKKYYTFERNPKGATYQVTKRQDGTYRVSNRKDIVVIGFREEEVSTSDKIESIW